MGDDEKILTAGNPKLGYALAISAFLKKILEIAALGKGRPEFIYSGNHGLLIVIIKDEPA
jgi:hypothetical protein